MEEVRSKVLINLASREYFKAIEGQLEGIRVITPVFKEFRQGEYTIVSIFTKRARGLMSRFIITHRLSRPQHLKAFDEDGYRFNPGLTKGDNWIFTRG